MVDSKAKIFSNFVSPHLKIQQPILPYLAYLPQKRMIANSRGHLQNHQLLLCTTLTEHYPSQCQQHSEMETIHS